MPQNRKVVPRRRRNKADGAVPTADAVDEKRADREDVTSPPPAKPIQEKIVIHSLLAKDTERALTTVFPGAWVRAKNALVVHTHPVLAALRKAVEKAAVMDFEQLGLSFMEVGAGLRVISYKLKVPVRYNAFRDGSVGASFRARMLAAQALAKGVTDKMCSCDVRECVHVLGMDAALMTHVAYYLSPEEVAAVVRATKQRLVHLVTHIFDGQEGTLPLDLGGNEIEYVEARWSTLRDGRVQMTFEGDKSSYPPHNSMAWLRDPRKLAELGLTAGVRMSWAGTYWYAVEALDVCVPVSSPIAPPVWLEDYRVPVVPVTWYQTVCSWFFPQFQTFRLDRRLVTNIVAEYQRLNLSRTLAANGVRVAATICPEGEASQYAQVAAYIFMQQQSQIVSGVDLRHYMWLVQSALGLAPQYKYYQGWVGLGIGLALLWLLRRAKSSIVRRVRGSIASQLYRSISWGDYVCYHQLGWGAGLVMACAEYWRQVEGSPYLTAARTLVHCFEAWCHYTQVKALKVLGFLIHYLYNLYCAMTGKMEKIYVARQAVLDVAVNAMVGRVAFMRLLRFVGQLNATGGPHKPAVVTIVPSGRTGTVAEGWTDAVVDEVWVQRAVCDWADMGPICLSREGKNVRFRRRERAPPVATYSRAYGIVVAGLEPYSFANCQVNEMRGLTTRMWAKYLTPAWSCDRELADRFVAFWARRLRPHMDYGDYESWSLRHGMAYKAAYDPARVDNLVGRSLGRSGPHSRQAFVKVETQCGNKAGSEKLFTDPRIIMNVAPGAATELGPFFVAFMQAMKQACKHSDDVYCAAGANFFEMGHWIERMHYGKRTGIMFNGDDCVVVIKGMLYKGDVSRMDGNTTPARLLEMLELYEELGLEPRAAQLYENMIEKKGNTKNGIIFRHVGTTGSGEHDTTARNCSLNGGYIALGLLEGLGADEIISRHRWLGWKLELNPCSLDTVSFCSGYFWPVLPIDVPNLGVVQRVYGPKLGRFICRAFHDPYGQGFKHDRYVKSIAQGWNGMLDHVPLVGAWLRAILRKHDVVVPYAEVVNGVHQWSPGGQCVGDDVAAANMIASLYGIGGEQLEQLRVILDRHVETGRPQMVQSDLLIAMYKVDTA